MNRVNRDQLLQMAQVGDQGDVAAGAAPHASKDGENLTLIDVRERDEFVQGHLPGAVFIPRGFLELQIEQVQPDRDAPLVIYCAGGVRSLLAARNLKEYGLHQSGFPSRRLQRLEERRLRVRDPQRADRRTAHALQPAYHPE